MTPARLFPLIVLLLASCSAPQSRVLSRADVIAYRDGFEALVKCARSATDAAVCADNWAAAAAPLQTGIDTDGRRARAYASAYITQLLRAGQSVPTAWNRRFAALFGANASAEFTCWKGRAPLPFTRGGCLLRPNGS